MEQYLEKINEITTELYEQFKWAHPEPPQVVFENDVIRVVGIFTIYGFQISRKDSALELIIFDSINGNLLGSEFEDENLYYLIYSLWHSIYVEEAGFITKVKNIMNAQAMRQQPTATEISA